MLQLSTVVDAFSEKMLTCPFSEETRQAGRDLFESGKIRLIEQAEPNVHEARVPFFRRFHTVTLGLNPDGSADHFCTCPHLANTGEGCAHLYGLLLAVQERLEEEAGEEEVSPLVPYWVIEPGLGPLRLAAYERPDAEQDTLVPCPMNAENLGRETSDEDLQILRLVAPCAGGRRSLLDGGGFTQPDGPWEIPADLTAELLPRLAGTGHLRIRSSDQDLRPLELEPQRSFDLVMRVERQPGKLSSFWMRGLLVWNDDAIRIEDTDALVPGEASLAALSGRLVGVRSFGASAWMKLLMNGRAIPVSEDEVTSFVKRLGDSGPLPRIWLPDEPAPLPLETGTPEPLLRVEDDDGDMACTLTFSYSGQVVEPGAPECLFWSDREPPTQIHPDPAQEKRLLARLLSGGARADSGVFGRYLLSREAFRDQLPGLVEDGFGVELNLQRVRRCRGQRLAFSDREDGIRLEGGALFDDHVVSMADVIRGWKAGETFLHLQDGSLALIPQDWAKKREPLLSLGDEQDGGLLFHRAQALVVHQILEGQQDLPPARDLVETRQHLLQLASPPAAHTDEGFEGTLRPYQAEGLGWLRTLASCGLGGCLADDMGLGKTVQVAAFLLASRAEDDTNPRPALVVVPRSLMFNWEQELARFTPGLTVTRHAGASRHARVASLGAHDVVLTTYGTLHRDIEVLEEQDFKAVVLDEAQAIKNPDSRAAQAARRLRSDIRISVTGTPVENKLLDFWSQMEFLNPGLLGPRRRFLRTMSGRTAAGMRAMLARTLRPLILRRTKEKVAPDLPEKVEQVLFAGLTEAQSDLYQRIREKVRCDLEQRISAEGLSSSRMHVLEGLLRLRQVACHPGLVDPQHAEMPSGKLDMLMERLSEVLEGGHKALVFSQFTSFLHLVRERLERDGHAHAWLDGSTRRREEVVQRFQEDPACPLFLISLKAGGVGLNLTAADYVFLLDPWWNPAVEAQAIDRAHRIGRDRRVLAFRLVARGTIEEKVLALQERKRDLVDDLLGTGSSSLTDLTEADLALLLGT